jgi:hypothetical protein
MGADFCCELFIGCGVPSVPRCQAEGMLIGSLPWSQRRTAVVVAGDLGLY